MKQLFRSLAEKLWPPKKRPYTLTEGQYHLLKDLMRSDGWALYVHLIDRRIQSLGEQMLFAPDTEVLERRGQIKGLLDSTLFVDNLLKSKEYEDATRRRQAERDKHRTAALAAGAKHTPFALH